MRASDYAYILRERKRRADPQCPECEGEGTTMSDSPCACLRAGDGGEPNPWADEGNSDARELARERD